MTYEDITLAKSSAHNFTAWTFPTAFTKILGASFNSSQHDTEGRGSAVIAGFSYINVASCCVYIKNNATTDKAYSGAQSIIIYGY